MHVGASRGDYNRFSSKLFLCCVLQYFFITLKIYSRSKYANGPLAILDLIPYMLVLYIVSYKFYPLYGRPLNL